MEDKFTFRKQDKDENEDFGSYSNPHNEQTSIQNKIKKVKVEEVKEVENQRANPMKRVLQKLKTMKEQDLDFDNLARRNDQSWDQALNQSFSPEKEDDLNVNEQISTNQLKQYQNLNSLGITDQNNMRRKMEKTRHLNFQIPSPNPRIIGKLLNQPEYETDDSLIKIEEKQNMLRKSQIDKESSHSKTRLPIGFALPTQLSSLQKNNSKSFDKIAQSKIEEQETITILNEQLRHVPIKYCQAIFIYFEGLLKSEYHLHSMAPQNSQVQISKKPIIQNLGAEFTERKMQDFPDIQCAQALKISGDIFRILPANEFNYKEKIRKIMKGQKKLDIENQFKYGENLESLNDEIKFNLEVFDTFKNELTVLKNFISENG